MMRLAIFPGLCFCILVSARSIFRNKLVLDEIISATNESHFAAPLVAANVRESSPTQSIEINGASSISFSSAYLKSRSHPFCSRDEIKEGSWEPIVIDAPPYFPRTVHLRCYPESEYKSGEWIHTYKWLPSASSSGNCYFPDWDRDDFCRLMKRATLLVRGILVSFLL